MRSPDMLIVTIAVALFAVFAGTLAWAQQHARPMKPAPAEVFRRRRRPY